MAHIRSRTVKNSTLGNRPFLVVLPISTLKVSCGSRTASPLHRKRGRKTPESRRAFQPPARRLGADIVAKVFLHHWTQIFRAVEATFE